MPPTGCWKERGRARRKTKGKFIALEGGDGTGKSTQIRLLASFLEGLGIFVQTTREPDSPLILKALSGCRSKKEACLLFAADRASHSEKVEGLLRGGAWVVCDRFTDSSLAYQAGGWGMDLRQVEEVNAFATRLVPDLTLILSCPAPLAAARMRRRGQESGFDLDLALQKRVSCLYRLLALRGGERKLVDASGTERQVESRIREEVKRKWNLKS